MNYKLKLGVLALPVFILIILLFSPLLRTTGFYMNDPLRLYTPALAQSSDPPAPGSLILTDEQGNYVLGRHMDILEDPGGKLTIEEVTSPEYAARFIPSQVNVPNFGYTNSVIWVRLPLENESSRTDEWLLEVGFSNVQYVDLFTPLPDNKGFTVKQTGALRPVSTRDIFYPSIVFKLIVPTQQQQTYYLRFQSGASMTLPLSLWTVNAFLDKTLKEKTLLDLFYGMLIGLLFFNIFLLIVLRETSYLYIVIFLASITFQLASYDGYTEIYLFPKFYYLKPYYHLLSFSLIFVSMLLFADTSLEFKSRFPVFHRVTIIILSVWGMLALLVPFVSYHLLTLLMVLWAFVSMITLLVAGIILWRKDFQPARYYMISWFGLLASLILFFLARSGLIPSTFLVENLFRLGLIWMAIYWSIALANRITLLKAETEVANLNLRNSENRLSQILEGVPLGIVLYGKDYKPKYFNRRAVDILSNPAKQIWPDITAGRTLAQAIQYFSIQLAGSQQEYPLEKFPVYKAMHGEPAYIDDAQMDQGGQPVSLEYWANPVRDNAGNVESAVVAFQDITQRKQAEGELGDYRKHLERLVEERTTRLNIANEQLRLRLTWLSAVNKTHLKISSAANLEMIYEELSSIILQLLGADLVLILRWEIQGEQPEILYSSLQADDTPGIKKVQALFQKDSALRRDIELGKLITWSPDQTASFPAPLGEFFLEHNIQFSVLAPMMIIPHSFAGVLLVAACNPSWNLIVDQQLDLFERMALDLASRAQDAVLLDQALALATLGERDRLARELHDSVTQVLFSATLLAEVLPQIWQRDPEQGLQKLDKLRQLTRGALAEMRAMLLELRPSAITNSPLGDLLAQLADAITSRSGLQFQLFIEQIPSLPENVQINFYRIAQEALNNVVKHAQARLVGMSLSITALPADATSTARKKIMLEIEDDGVGFSTEGEKLGQMGIGFMHERAETIQANLSIESQPGHGTQVTLIWCGELERVQHD
jgi:signal transduction histidine kinase